MNFFIKQFTDIPSTLNPNMGKVADGIRRKINNGLLIFDMDETMTIKRKVKDAEVERLLALDQPRETLDWSQWNELLKTDRQNRRVTDIFRQAQKDNKAVAIMTARDDTARAFSEEWLARRNLIPDALIMRNLQEELKIGSSGTLKSKMIDEHLGPKLAARITGVYDDADSVVKMARGRNIPASLVTKGVPGPMLPTPRLSSARRQAIAAAQEPGNYVGMPLDRIQSIGRKGTL